MGGRESFTMGFIFKYLDNHCGPIIIAYLDGNISQALTMYIKICHIDVVATKWQDQS